MNVVIVILAVSLFSYVFYLNPQRTFNIKETYKITASDNADTFLRIALPDSNGYQKISNLKIEGAKDYTINCLDGWYEVTIRVPQNINENIISLSYTANLFRNILSWKSENIQEYLLPQQFVDSDNELVKKISAKLRGLNDYETAKNIFQYTNKIFNNHSESTVINQQSASEMLKNPVGVCYDHAILMTALLRAEGIPARMISGLALRVPLKGGKDWSHPGVAHAWVEFYADDMWHFADPTWGNGYFGKTDTSHLSFGTFEAYINSDFQQNRLKTIENDGYYIFGAMSTPLSFTAFSTDKNATVIPRADVEYSWIR